MNVAVTYFPVQHRRVHVATPGRWATGGSEFESLYRRQFCFLRLIRTGPETPPPQSTVLWEKLFSLFGGKAAGA
jgi:hypothetical protein